MSNENETVQVVIDPKQTAGFDIEGQQELARLEDEGVDVHVESASGLPMFYETPEGLKPVTWRVTGTNSTRYRKAEEAQRRRKIKSAKLTGEKLHEDQVDKVVACSISFSGFTSRGQNVEFSPHNAKMILKACPWVLDQLIEAMGDHERFGSRA